MKQTIPMSSGDRSSIQVALATVFGDSVELLKRPFMCGGRVHLPNVGRWILLSFEKATYLSVEFFHGEEEA